MKKRTSTPAEAEEQPADLVERYIATGLAIDATSDETERKATATEHNAARRELRRRMLGL